jgi:hypothetical protein
METGRKGKEIKISERRSCAVIIPKPRRDGA